MIKYICKGTLPTEKHHIYLDGVTWMKNRVAALRKEKKMSQNDLVKALNVSRQTVSSIENGRYNPSLDLAFVIAKALGEPIEKVFFRN